MASFCRQLLTHNHYKSILITHYCNNDLVVAMIIIGLIVAGAGAGTAAQSVPALYIFGDSLVDVGNNNHLPLSVLKANFPHNGIDYPGKSVTGRFSNGRNAADFIAERVGLASPPPYLSQPNSAFIKGVSFASGGAGIFNGTDEGLIRQKIPLANQIELFSKVRDRLVKEMGATAAEKHLSKSVFPIVIGSNDIIGYFNRPQSQRNAPAQHVALMISTLQPMLQVLHGLGARKFVLVGMAPIGCAPKQRFDRNNTNECDEEVNYWSSKYNQGLVLMLHQLNLKLDTFHYSYFDAYSVFLDFTQNPLKYGMKEVKSACCGLGKLRAELPCTPISAYCPNRNEHLFWDIYHPTEATARILVSVLFDPSQDHTSPITMNQLIAI